MGKTGRGLALAVLALGAMVGGVALGGRPAIDPGADRQLRKMSDFLGQQQRFTVKAEGTTEVVEGGQKLQLERTGEVAVARPDRFRVDREGERASFRLFYDGQQVTFWGDSTRTYASTPAPPTIDATVKGARERLGDHPSSAELLMSDPYRALTEGVQSGRYVGKVVIDGVPVHHLAFHGERTDWQIWIEDGAHPLPRRMVVTSRTRPQAPESTLNLSEWNLAPRFEPDAFTFTPPEGASPGQVITPSSPGEVAP